MAGTLSALIFRQRFGRVCPRLFVANPLLRKIALTAALCAVVSGALAAQVTIVGRWRVLSGQSSHGGAYCTMQLGKVDTFVGIQVMANGDSILSVGSSDWSFDPKQKVPVKVAIDGAPMWNGQGVAVLPNTLVMSLPPNATPARALASGKSLVATVAEAPMTFDLAGAPAARDALESCVAAAKAP